MCRAIRDVLLTMLKRIASLNILNMSPTPSPANPALSAVLDGHDMAGEQPQAQEARATAPPDTDAAECEQTLSIVLCHCLSNNRCMNAPKSRSVFIISILLVPCHTAGANWCPREDAAAQRCKDLQAPAPTHAFAQQARETRCCFTNLQRTTPRGSRRRQRRSTRPSAWR